MTSRAFILRKRCRHRVPLHCFWSSRTIPGINSSRIWKSHSWEIKYLEYKCRIKRWGKLNYYHSSDMNQSSQLRWFIRNSWRTTRLSARKYLIVLHISTTGLIGGGKNIKKSTVIAFSDFFGNQTLTSYSAFFEFGTTSIIHGHILRIVQSTNRPLWPQSSTDVRRTNFE